MKRHVALIGALTLGCVGGPEDTDQDFYPSIEGAGPANFFTLEERSEGTLEFETDGLSEEIDPYNGQLRIGLDVFRLPGLSGRAHYSSAMRFGYQPLIPISSSSYPLSNSVGPVSGPLPIRSSLRQAVIQVPNSGGLPDKWSSNWFGRFVDYRALMEIQRNGGTTIPVNFGGHFCNGWDCNNRWTGTVRVTLPGGYQVDERRERVFAFEEPNGAVHRAVQAVPTLPAFSRGQGRTQQTLTDMSVIEPVVVDGVLDGYRRTTTDGTVYRLDHYVAPAQPQDVPGVGPVSIGQFGLEGWYPTRISRNDGSFVEIHYYGQHAHGTCDPSDAVRMNTSLPRLVHVGQIVDDADEIVASAYFIRPQYEEDRISCEDFLRWADEQGLDNVNCPAGGIPTFRRLETIAAGIPDDLDDCVPGDIRLSSRAWGGPAYSVNLAGIRFPGPNATATTGQPAQGWLLTRFDTDGLESTVTVNGRPYRFTMNSSDVGLTDENLELEDVASYRQLASVSLPTGAVLEYTYGADEIPRGWCEVGDNNCTVPGERGHQARANPGDSDPVFTVRSRTLRAPTAGGTSVSTWRLYHRAFTETDPRPGTGTPVRHVYAGAVIEGPAQDGQPMSTTVLRYGPTHLMNHPWSAKTGRIMRSEVYVGDVYNERLGRISPNAIPTVSTEHAYATFLLGPAADFTNREARPGNEPFNQAPMVWVAYPAAEVSTLHDSSHLRAPCCFSGQVEGERFACEATMGDAPDAESLCCDHESLVALEECSGAESSLECRSVVVDAERTAWCGAPRTQGCDRDPCGDGQAVTECDSELPACAAGPAEPVDRRVVRTFRGMSLRSQFGFDRTPPNNEIDFYGNSTYEEVVATDQDIRITRSSDRCEPGYCRYENGRWNCERFDCRQDALTASPTATDPSDVRRTTIEYLHADDSDYIDANLVHLPSEERVRNRDNTLLAHTTYEYDYADGGYPFATYEADGARGRLTRVRNHDVSGAARHTETATQYLAYGTGLMPGGVRQEAVLVGDNDYRMTRYGYASTHSVGRAGGPTHYYASVDGRWVSTGQRHYNAWGQLTRSIDENGNEERRQYDDRGRLIAAYLPDAEAPYIETTYSEWNGTGAWTPTEVTERRAGHPTLRTVRAVTVEYLDSLDRTIQARTNNGFDVVATEYVGVGRRIRRRTAPYALARAQGYAEPDWSTVAHTLHDYDAMGRPTSVARRVGTRRVQLTEYAYGDQTFGLETGSRRATIDVRDRETQVTEVSFDTFGRQRQVVLPDNSSLSWNYDALGRMTTLTHPDGLTTTRTYDGLGRLRTQTRPESGTVTFDYNLASDVTRRTDAARRVVRFTFDDRGRPLDTLPGGGRALIEHDYDTYPPDSSIVERDNSAGRVTRVTYGQSHTDFGYDEAGRIIERRIALRGLDEKTIRYEYAPGGLISAIDYQQGADDAMRIEYGYDNRLRRIDTEVNDLLRRRVASFAPGDHPKTVYLFQSNGTDPLETSNYAYDEFGRLRSLNNPDDLGADRFAYRLYYEDDWRTYATGRRDGLPSAMVFNSVGNDVAGSFIFEYDSRQRLTGADYGTVSGGNRSPSGFYDFRAAYDVVGNITSITRAPLATNQVTNHTVDPATRRVTALTGAHSATFRYDAAGYLTHDSRWGSDATLAYHPTGLVRSASAEGFSFGFEYDERGRRVITTSTDGTTGETRYTIRGNDGETLAEYRRESDDDADLLFWNVDDVGYQVPGNRNDVGRAGFHYQLTDHLGSPRVTFFENGTLEESTDYDPFGLPLERRGRRMSAEGTPFGFTGYEHHSELGSPFYYAHARLYDPTIGRFMRPDPLAQLEPETTSYAYARNQPLSLVDPTGLVNEQPCCDELTLRLSLSGRATLGLATASATLWGAYRPSEGWDGGFDISAGFTANPGLKVVLTGTIEAGYGDESGKLQGTGIHLGSVPLPLPPSPMNWKGSVSGTFVFDGPRLVGARVALSLSAGLEGSDLALNRVRDRIGLRDPFSGFTPAQRQAIEALLVNIKNGVTPALNYAASAEVSPRPRPRSRSGLRNALDEAYRRLGDLKRGARPGWD